MGNQYTVWQEESGRVFFNPNCHHSAASVGDVINGSKCIMVGTLERCSEYTSANQPEAGTFADLL